MKNLARICSVMICIALLFSGCGGNNQFDPEYNAVSGNHSQLGGTDDSFGDTLDALGLYDGKFLEITQPVSIRFVSGTAGCYSIEGSTITFSNIAEDSVYAITGQWMGNIIIDVDDSCKFDLEMQDFSIICDYSSPIVVLGGNEVTLTAKKDSSNYIYDLRPEVDETDSTQFSASVYAMVDLEIAGKGSLNVVSESNNGIHGKDDLLVKNLSLAVYCADNALKGNDSVTLENCATTLISTVGDGIKTTNSGISEKGNQQGSVKVLSGNHIIYAACDGIDAAYDVLIAGEDTNLCIYTDKYSNYSKEVTQVDTDQNYIRFNTDLYQYSVKYYNSDTDYQWVNGEYHSAVSGSRTKYYYYSYPKLEGYSKVQFFIYSSDQALSQDQQYLAASELLTPNVGCDTIAFNQRGNQISYEWTNYTTTVQDNFGPGGMGGHGGPGGFGGMGEGNPDKGDHSTKGIKAANQILIENGTVTVKSYDDALHANADTVLENGDASLGNVTIQRGNITLYSNDDGIHADGVLEINGGSIAVVNSYEGAEGASIEINGGSLTLISSDDGMNCTTVSGNGVIINNGSLYIYCSGDGIDSNSRTAYCGIIFNGGKTVVITTSGGNSAIDTEQGYTYNGGSVLAIMPNGGMTNEAIHCQNFSAVAARNNLSLSAKKFVSVSVDDQDVVSVQIPTGMNAIVIYLGSSSADISSENSVSGNLDSNGVCWNLDQ